jgi:dihydrofolate reductase
MRKLKLQMSITVDGFVADANGKNDFLTGVDDKVMEIDSHLVDTSDTILMGRKMADEFVTYWEAIAAKPGDPWHDFAQKMVRTQKIVFSHSVKNVKGQNIRVENGPLVETVNALKNQPGKDLLVYGGVTFVKSLIENKLIDEYHLLINPVAIGTGKGIFPDRTGLSLVKSVSSPKGTVINSYVPALFQASFPTKP